MKVFCPEHGKGFFAPRRNPVKCENRGHSIGELDFEGVARTPAAVQWEYCCNCEHFFLLGSSTEGIERCPACARQLFARYVCDRCYLVTSESNTRAQFKNFTLTAEGLPRPTCPGCLQSPASNVREHECDELGAVFVTALTVCPLCEERLDVSPAFPASVTYYLKRTRKKLNVTFDYDSGLFCRAEDGEFVLVQNGNETSHQLMLPRMARFSTNRDFYDHYQDSFYCMEPTAGEVQVIEPAVVCEVEHGWKLQTHGLLEVVSDSEQPKKSNGSTRRAKTAEPAAQATSSQNPLPVSTDTKAQSIIAQAISKTIEQDVAISESAASVTCVQCHSVIESKYRYCWNCGSPRPAQLESTDVEPLRPARPNESIDPVTAGSESPSIFGWALDVNAEPPSQNHKKSSAKLVVLFLIGVVLFAALLFFTERRSASNVPTAQVYSDAPATESLAPTAAAGPVGQPKAPSDIRMVHPQPEKIKNTRAKHDSRRRR